MNGSHSVRRSIDRGSCHDTTTLTIVSRESHATGPFPETSRSFRVLRRSLFTGQNPSRTCLTCVGPLRGSWPVAFIPVPLLRTAGEVTLLLFDRGEVKQLTWCYRRAFPVGNTCKPAVRLYTCAQLKYTLSKASAYSR